MTTGTYSLLLSIESPTTVDVGALGELAFDAGWYVYTGSAHGPGGFARVDRHRRVAAKGTDRPHWHVDYLLAAASLEAAYTWAGADRECDVAGRLPGDRVAGFGASDCSCGSHLAVAPDEEPLRRALEAVYGEPTR